MRNHPVFIVWAKVAYFIQEAPDAFCMGRTARELQVYVVPPRAPQFVANRAQVKSRVSARWFKYDKVSGISKSFDQISRERAREIGREGFQ
jgi:hypothetical protein